MRSDRALTFGSVLTAALASVLTPACIVPKTTCEYTKTCATADDDGSVEPGESGNHAATGADADIDAYSVTSTISAEAGTSSSNIVDSGPADASIDPTPAFDADTSIGEVLDCERLIDCPDELPVCHLTEHVCTQCDKKFDCNPTPGTPLCKIELGHEQDNTCVQCLENADCVDSVCVDNTCLACNPKTNDGCTENLPQCVLFDQTPTCVMCDGNEHCDPALPVCQDHQCVLCTNEDATHCPEETPHCVADETTARCVGCRNDGDCTGLSAGDSTVDGLCIDEQCTSCELGTDRNCSSTAPFCVALLPEADGEVTRYAPTDTDGGSPSEQYLAFEHQCVECLDSDELLDEDSTTRPACKGARPGCYEGNCVECTKNAHCKDVEASVCDTELHLCVGCSAVGECAHQELTPACDIDNNRCVECTAERPTACDDKVCQTIPGDGQYTCSDEPKTSADLCTPCLGDTHCRADSACVREVYDDLPTDYRCLAIQDEVECGERRPFVGSVTATSIDGLSATFCKPRSTSCQGYSDYGAGPVSNDAGLASCNSDDDCGLVGVDDGICVPWTGTSNRCSYLCAGQDDCNSLVPCATITAVDDNMYQVCSLDP